MEFFTSKKISERVTRICDCADTKMYLVEGNNMTALIDTGSGVGNLYEYVRTLTDKPLIVILTHGHLDHAMGTGTFPYKPGDSDWYEPRAFEEIKPIKVGDTFDIGGEVLLICQGQGHTLGCVTVLFQNERSLLLGDAVNGSIFLFDDDCLSVPEFKTSLEKLKSQTDGRYDRTYLCHGSGNGTMDLVDGAICFLSVLVPADPFQNDISCKYNGRMTYHWVINKKHKC